MNQNDRDERTQKVRLMTNIYSTAELVAIWLGPEEDDSALTIRLLRNLTDQANLLEGASRLLSSLVGERGLAAVASIFAKDYWRRLWIVQEILNVTSITVYYGSSKTS